MLNWRCSKAFRASMPGWRREATPKMRVAAVSLVIERNNERHERASAYSVRISNRGCQVRRIKIMKCASLSGRASATDSTANATKRCFL